LQDLFADPAYFQKPKRLVIEDVKGLKPEDFDDFFRAHAADVVMRPEPKSISMPWMVVGRMIS